jgi:hypothetical protein
VGFLGVRTFLTALDHRLGPALDRAMPTFDARAQLVHGMPVCRYLGNRLASILKNLGTARS